jgi:hypothetical protein
MMNLARRSFRRRSMNMEMIEDGPSPTRTTTNLAQGEGAIEGEVASRREPPQ